MTTAIISVETVLLLVLLVLVAGLLRSHAEILRRLATGAGSTTDPRIAAGVGRERADGTPAPAVSGPTPTGDAISLQLAAGGGEPTLLAFLTSGRSTCAGFWATLAEPRLPAGIRTVIVTHGSERERPAALRELAPDGIPVVMSSEAWRDYAVPGAPYFVLANGTIRGEGAATSWTALASLVSDAIADARETTGRGDRIDADGRDGASSAGGRIASGTARALTVDRTLAGAGIGPGHPSLYPGGPADRDGRPGTGAR